VIGRILHAAAFQSNEPTKRFPITVPSRPSQAPSVMGLPHCADFIVDSSQSSEHEPSQVRDNICGLV
jgi:hypothetical protein